jgi:salicylate hydroxylase
VNFFAVVEYPKIWPHADKWLDSIEPGEAVAAFEGWHPAVIEMVAQHLPVRWALFGTRPLLHWYRGSVVILGDAAHAMLPHHGQGANTTIEDAITLAELLPGRAPDGLAPLLAKYQSLRRARTRKSQRSSWITNALLHLPDGPQLAERDRQVARFPENFGWIRRVGGHRGCRQALRLPGERMRGWRIGHPPRLAGAPAKGKPRNCTTRDNRAYRA